jgi:hypothetical protein
MEKLDLKKQLRHLYSPPSREVVEVDVPTMSFLMVDGTGDPNTSQAYAEALEALYALSYTLKFAAKKGPLQIDYPVMSLEGLWWADDLTDFAADRDAWKWTMMIMQPDCVTAEMVAAATAGVARKKDPVALSLVRFETFAEGLSAQTMHLGPFADEAPTIARVHQFIAGAGKQLRGKHHEIYLSDIRKADPAKWKTVVRQPMQ